MSYFNKNVDLLYVDVRDPYKDPTYNDFTFFLTLVGDHSQATSWKAAMENKILALESNITWALVSLSPGKKTVGCK